MAILNLKLESFGGFLWSIEAEPSLDNNSSYEDVLSS